MRSERMGGGKGGGPPPALWWRCQDASLRHATGTRQRPGFPMEFYDFSEAAPRLRSLLQAPPKTAHRLARRRVTHAS